MADTFDTMMREVQGCACYHWKHRKFDAAINRYYNRCESKQALVPSRDVTGPAFYCISCIEEGHWARQRPRP